MPKNLDKPQKDYLVALMATTTLNNAPAEEVRVLSLELVNLLLPELRGAGGLSKFVNPLETKTTGVIKFGTYKGWLSPGESLMPSDRFFNNEDEVRVYLLRYLHGHLVHYVRPLIKGQEVMVEAGLPGAKLKLNEDGTLSVDLDVPQESAGDNSLHDALCEIDSVLFTFIRDSNTMRYLKVCPMCGTVFARQRMGKPRKFCSVSCRAKGIPSAKKRAEYTRTQRKKVREAESDIAREIMNKTRSEEGLIALLMEAFDRKSRRQCRNLLKRVERTERPLKEV